MTSRNRPALFAGAELAADLHGRDQAWHDFAGGRVNYDIVLLALCSITMAPPAAWSSDRAPAFRTPESSRRDL
jgi:hypothetical protein